MLALVTPLASHVDVSSPPAAAQSASPVASPAASPFAPTPVPVALPTAADLGITLPAGIDVTTLAAAPIDSAGTSILLRLERVTVPAAGELPQRTPTGPELLYGELGTATVVDAFGLSAPINPGQQAALVQGSAYILRNTGTAPASLLRLVLGDLSVPLDVGSQTLLEATLPAPPTTPATMLIALASFQPGADTGTFTASGPVGFLVNAGTLTVTSPSGLEAPLTSGQGLVFPAGVPQDEGFGGWAVSQDWATVGGMLVNDGTNNDYNRWLQAPFVPEEMTDYAVESEIQVVNGTSPYTFGVVGRATEDGGYWAGPWFNCCPPSAGIAAGANPFNYGQFIASSPYEPVKS